MNRFRTRVENIEDMRGECLSLEEKLEIAFEEQSKKADFIELLESGANPQGLCEAVKKMNKGRLSMYQLDLLRLIDQYR